MMVLSDPLTGLFVGMTLMSILCLGIILFVLRGIWRLEKKSLEEKDDELSRRIRRELSYLSKV